MSAALAPGMHDDPSIYPTLPGKEVDEPARWILDAMPEDDRWRKCWEYVLTHQLTEREGAAFWHGASIAAQAHALEEVTLAAPTQDPTP